LEGIAYKKEYFPPSNDIFCSLIIVVYVLFSTSSPSWSKQAHLFYNLDLKLAKITVPIWNEAHFLLSVISEVHVYYEIFKRQFSNSKFPSTIRHFNNTFQLNWGVYCSTLVSYSRHFIRNSSNTGNSNRIHNTIISTQGLWKLRVFFLIVKRRSLRVSYNDLCTCLYIRGLFGNYWDIFPNFFIIPDKSIKFH
jgi:hypothetical protein